VSVWPRGFEMLQISLSAKNPPRGEKGLRKNREKLIVPQAESLN
jgi:hypothetical protein